jgi:hypothetical protein
MAMASMGSSALSGVTSAIGGVLGGNSQSSMYKYQAGVARVNAQIARGNAAYSRYAGEFESQRSGMKTRFERGRIVANQSGRGVQVGTGSAGRVVESTEDIGRQEQSTIRASAARRAYGYENEAAQQEASANMLGKAAQRSKLAGYIQAGTSLLSSAASVSSKWSQASQSGIFSDSVGYAEDNKY